MRGRRSDRGRGVRRPRRATRRAGGAGRRRVERTRDARCVAGGRGRSRRGRAGARRRRRARGSSGNTPRSTELRHGDRRGRSGGGTARAGREVPRVARAHLAERRGAVVRGGEQPKGERTRACSACVRMASATRRGVGTFPPTGEYEKGVGKIQTGWLRGASANARVGGNPRVVNPGRKLATPSAPRGRSKARDPRVINPSGFPEPVAAPEISKSAVRPERTSHDADARPSSIGPPSPLGRATARARAAPRLDRANDSRARVSVVGFRPARAERRRPRGRAAAPSTGVSEPPRRARRSGSDAARRRRSGTQAANRSSTNGARSSVHAGSRTPRKKSGESRVFS